VAKYFAIIPALFVATYPQLNTLNIMKLHSPRARAVGRHLQRAGHRGADPVGVARGQVPGHGLVAILRRNVFIYGVGGIIVPFVFIKLIDLLLVALHAY